MSPTSRSRASGGASSPAVARKSETASRNGTSGYQAIAVMERHLATGPFFVGDSYSIADIALYAYTHVAHEGGFELNAYPGIGAWLKRVEAEPGYVPLAWRP